MDWEDRQRDRATQALRDGRVVHVTHADCLDGMSCLGLTTRVFPSLAWIGVQPHETAKAIGWLADALEGLPGKGGPASAPAKARILVTDLSIQGRDIEGTLARLAAIRPRADLVWLDHHDAQWPTDLESRVREATALCLIDRTGAECGATMTLDFLERLHERPVGAFSLPGPAPFGPSDHAAMRAVAHRDTFSDPDDEAGIRLGLASARLREDYAVLVRHGEYRALDLLAEGPLRRRKRDLKEAFGRVRRTQAGVAWVFGRAPLTDLAHAYWPAHPEARLLLQFTDDGRLRIRSHPDHPLAQRLAAAYGGGGHAHAAGATLVAGDGWRLRMYRLLGVRDPRVRRVLKEADGLAKGNANAPIGAAGTPAPQ